MRAKLVFVSLATVAFVLPGCFGNQTRTAPENRPPEDMIHEEQARHGAMGYEIAEIWHDPTVKEGLADTSGEAFGFVPNEFYQIQIAPDPKQPTALVVAGYLKKVTEDRGAQYFYHFYSRNWERIAWLTPKGELYRFESGREEFIGRMQLTVAVNTLYPAPSGYGYDALLQDRSRVRADNPDVASAEPRARGVAHTTHSDAPPVIVYSLYRAGEAGHLAERAERKRFEDTEAERLKRLREARDAGIGQDESYGGLQYKNGNPVDAEGRPLRPRSLGND